MIILNNQLRIDTGNPGIVQDSVLVVLAITVREEKIFPFIDTRSKLLPFTLYLFVLKSQRMRETWGTLDWSPEASLMLYHQLRQAPS